MITTAAMTAIERASCESGNSSMWEEIVRACRPVMRNTIPSMTYMKNCQKKTPCKLVIELIRRGPVKLV